MQIRRSFFTLFELLIVMLVLSFALALTGIKIKESYEEQRFLTEVEQVVSQLQMAQDLMLILNADAKVRFFRDQESKKICCQIEMEKVLPLIWGKIAEKTHILEAIRWVEFAEQNVDSEQGVALRFFSKGFAMSKGQLLLTSHERVKRTEDGRTYIIDLVGHPSFIDSRKFLKKQSDLLDKNSLPSGEALYPKELLKIEQVQHEAAKEKT